MKKNENEHQTYHTHMYRYAYTNRECKLNADMNLNEELENFFNFFWSLKN